MSSRIAELEERVDALVTAVNDLRARLTAHIDRSEQHTSSWLLHRGTVAGALGPVLVGVIELIRHFVM